VIARLRRDTTWLVAAWWLAIALTLIAVRPATIVDETRYLSVAWEMFRSGDWLLLRLNGELYGHKPPLIFWLINLGWHLFGVSVWWPRLLTVAFGFGALLVLMALVRRIAPERDETAALAALYTGSALVWVAYAGAVMFDVPLAFFVIVALLQVVRAASGDGLRAWAAAGVAMGLGVLTKGPVMLLHVLPLALLGFWWRRSLPGAAQTNGARWYAGVGIAIVVAAAVALAWVIPAAVTGGDAFRTEILWRQSAGRVASEDFHGRPFWFHALILPVLLLPWTLFPPFWRGVISACRRPLTLASRFALAWFVPVFLVFSTIKGKQLHYLLPEIAALATLAACGIALDAPERVERTVKLARIVGSSAIALFLLGYLAVGPRLLPRYDLRDFAAEIARAQQRGQPVAHFGTYHGEYQFSGRLQRPLTVLNGPDAVKRWASAHPDGAIVIRTKAALTGAPPLATHAYRKDHVALVRSGDLATFGDAWYR
jgi:4-amino-4-deoxy-L-arabinose transferase-like glycosyltransferase